MKIFKRIYYPVMAALFVLMFTLSFINAAVGNQKNRLGDEFVSSVKVHLDAIAGISHNSIYEDKQEQVATYITKKLDEAGLMLGRTYVEEDENVYEYSTSLEGKPIGTYILQKDTISQETLKLIDEDRDANSTAVWEVNKQISNIVVYIPGTTTLSAYTDDNSTATGDVVMMMAHYDSRIEGAGASDNGTQVASMLQNIITLTKSNSSFKNDLLFVFTDAEEEGMYGAYMFKNQFNGFDDIYSRVKLGTNFDALGNKGTLVMFESSDDNYNLISAYSKINGNTFTSSIADFVYGGMSTYTDFSIYGDIPSLNFATLGGGEIYHSAHDTIANVSDSTIIQQSNMMNEIIGKFGNYDLSKLDSSSDAVYFSYLDAFTVVFPYAVSYVFGAIMLCLLLGIILLNKRNKVFRWTKTGSGIVVQLLSILGTVIVLFALYYIYSLLTVAMGIIPLRAIGNLTHESLGFLISFMLLAVVVSSFLSLIFRKLFNVNSSDIVRGNVFIWALIGIIMSFAAPHLGYFFAITALLELLVMLAITALSAKFKSKFGTPMGVLFPYMLPILVALPMIVPVITIASMILKTMFVPLLMILFLLMSGFITPYCKLLEPSMQRLFAKLPRLSRRVEKEITETVEDKAKKGKFVEKTSIVVVKEKVSFKYRPAYIATLLTVILSIFAIVFSSIGLDMGKNYSGFGRYRTAVNNSSLVLVWEKIDNNSQKTFLKVEDFVAFNYINEAVGGFSWNFSNDAYTKNIQNTANLIAGNPDITINGSEYYFSVYSSERGLVTLKLSDTENLSKISIKSADGEIFEYENTEKSESIVINLPYRFGSFTMTVEGVDHINFEYTEAIMDIGSSVANLAELEDWINVMDFYSGKSSVTDYLSSGIVFRIVRNRF